MAIFSKFLAESSSFRGHEPFEEVWKDRYAKELLVVATYIYDRVLKSLGPDYSEFFIDGVVGRSTSARSVAFRGVKDFTRKNPTVCSTGVTNGVRCALRYMGISPESIGADCGVEPAGTIFFIASWRSETSGLTGSFMELKAIPGSVIQKAVVSYLPYKTWKSERADAKNKDAPSQ